MVLKGRHRGYAPVLARTMVDKQQTSATQNCYPNIRCLIDAKALITKPNSAQTPHQVFYADIHQFVLFISNILINRRHRFKILR